MIESLKPAQYLTSIYAYLEAGKESSICFKRMEPSVAHFVKKVYLKWFKGACWYRILLWMATLNRLLWKMPFNFDPFFKFYVFCWLWISVDRKFPDSFWSSQDDSGWVLFRKSTKAADDEIGVSSKAAVKLQQRRTGRECYCRGHLRRLEPDTSHADWWR